MGRHVENSIEERLWSKVKIGESDECWPWQGSTSQGYGIIRYDNNKRICAHRLAYMLYYGELDENSSIRHHCDNPSCCNPRHLIQGTHQENMQDAVIRNRMCHGENKSNAKLDDETVRNIKRIRKERPDITLDKIAKFCGVSRSLVSGIISGERWSHIKI